MQNRESRGALTNDSNRLNRPRRLGKKSDGREAKSNAKRFPKSPFLKRFQSKKRLPSRKYSGQILARATFGLMSITGIAGAVAGVSAFLKEALRAFVPDSEEARRRGLMKALRNVEKARKKLDEALAKYNGLPIGGVKVSEEKGE